MKSSCSKCKTVFRATDMKIIIMAETCWKIKSYPILITKKLITISVKWTQKFFSDSVNPENIYLELTNRNPSNFTISNLKEKREKSLNKITEFTIITLKNINFNYHFFEFIFVNCFYFWISYYLFFPLNNIASLIVFVKKLL